MAVPRKIENLTRGTGCSIGQMIGKNQWFLHGLVSMSLDLDPAWLQTVTPQGFRDWLADQIVGYAEKVRSGEIEK